MTAYHDELSDLKRFEGKLDAQLLAVEWHLTEWKLSPFNIGQYHIGKDCHEVYFNGKLFPAVSELRHLDVREKVLCAFVVATGITKHLLGVEFVSVEQQTLPNVTAGTVESAAEYLKTVLAFWHARKVDEVT